MNKDNLHHKSNHVKPDNTVTTNGKALESAKKKKKKLHHTRSPELQTKLTSVLKSLKLKHADPTSHPACVEHVHPTKVTLRPVTTTATNVAPSKVMTVDEVKGIAPDGTWLDHAGFPKDSYAQEPEQVAPKKTKFLDLYPWPFEKTFKGVIRHREWNGLVKNIQEAVDCESAHENDHLHEEIAHLLDERDALQAKLTEMREYILKEHREFEAHFN